MASYIMKNDIHPLIQTIGGVFNRCGDLNFIFHDEYNNVFCEFPNVSIEYNDGARDSLPAYSK